MSSFIKVKALNLPRDMRLEYHEPVNDRGEKGFSVSLSRKYRWAIGYRKLPTGAWFDTRKSGFFRECINRSLVDMP